MIDSEGAASCTYHILRGGAPAVTLRGVLNEPIFQADINGGFAALALDLDHYPAELQWFDIIRIDLPDGSVAGKWKHEEQDVQYDAATRTFTLALVPLVAELSEAGYQANWTTDHTQLSAPLGPADPSLMTTAAIARTAHCTAGTVQALGALWPYAFNDAQPVDALNQHVLFAGPGWWWFSDGQGVTSVRNTPPATITLTMGRDSTGYHEKDNVHGLTNIQPLTGGTPQGSNQALTSVAGDYTAGQYGTLTIGRRQAATYNDSSLLTQAACDVVAANLLALGKRITVDRTVTIENYVGPWILPGSQVYLRQPAADPAGPYVVQGPFIVSKSTRLGATGHYDLELTDVASPIKTAGGAGIATPAVALGSLMKNPARLASVMPFGFGLQPVDVTHNARCRFEIPSNVLVVTKALLSFSLQPFRSGQQSSTGGSTSGAEGAHTHGVSWGDHSHGTPNHSHGTPNHSHSTYDHRHLLATTAGNIALGLPANVYYFSDASGTAIYSVQSPSGDNADLYTRTASGASSTPSGGGGTTPGGGGGTSGAGGATVVASAGGSAHSHTVPSESLNPPSGLYEAGMAQACHAIIDGVDRTVALAGPWGAGSAQDIADLDVTAWLSTQGWHEVQISSSTIGGIFAQLTIFATLGAS